MAIFMRKMMINALFSHAQAQPSKVLCRWPEIFLERGIPSIPNLQKSSFQQLAFQTATAMVPSRHGAGEIGRPHSLRVDLWQWAQNGLGHWALDMEPERLKRGKIIENPNGFL